MEGGDVGGGGGGCDRVGTLMGGRGAASGGGGGAAGGGGAEDGGGGGAEGAGADGLRVPGRTGGFFPIGGGGPFIDAEDAGLWALESPPVFRKFAIDGTDAGELTPFCGAGLGGGPDGGGLGAAIVGGLGAELLDDSGSEE